MLQIGATEGTLYLYVFIGYIKFYSFSMLHCIKFSGKTNYENNTNILLFKLFFAAF